MPGSYSDIFSTQTLDLANFGKNWVQNTGAGSKEWTSISVSASGQYQTAVVYGESIYISSNYGSTWTSTNTSAGNKDWKSVSISASGQYQTAVVYGGSIYISSNYGSSSTWTPITSTGNKNWQGVSVSASGQYQTAVVYGGSTYISSNYGSTWTSTNTSIGNKDWYSVSVSASGQYQTAVVSGGNIYISSNYGSSWTSTNILSVTKYWTGVSISASGQYQTALANTSYIHISSDYGSTWTEVTSIGTLEWFTVSISASGQYQTAAINGGNIIVSSDYGSTWTQISGTTFTWQGISMSASGQYITACYRSSADRGSIYTCQNSISNGVVSVGNYSSTPAGTIGSIYYDTTSSALKVYSGSTWSSIGSGGIITGTTGTFSNTVTAAAFNSTSDYRVKENIQDLNLNIYNVNPLRPVNYYNNRLNKLDIGFIAHEVQEYYPFLVSGEKDGEENQSLNYSGIIGILVKEIQELKQRVKQLEDDSQNK